MAHMVDNLSKEQVAEFKEYWSKWFDKTGAGSISPQVFTTEMRRMRAELSKPRCERTEAMLDIIASDTQPINFEKFLTLMMTGPHDLMQDDLGPPFPQNPEELSPTMNRANKPKTYSLPFTGAEDLDCEEQDVG